MSCGRRRGQGQFVPTGQAGSDGCIRAGGVAPGFLGQVNECGLEPALRIDGCFDRQASRPTFTLDLRDGQCDPSIDQLATSGGGTNPGITSVAPSSLASSPTPSSSGSSTSTRAAEIDRAHGRDRVDPGPGHFADRSEPPGRQGPAVPHPGRPPSEFPSSERGGLAAWFEAARPSFPAAHAGSRPRASTEHAPSTDTRTTKAGETTLIARLSFPQVPGNPDESRHRIRQSSLPMRGVVKRTVNPPGRSRVWRFLPAPSSEVM